METRDLGLKRIKPEASPPPMTTTPLLILLCRINDELATKMAAAPSARRAHSSTFVTGATFRESRTFFKVLGLRVNANGCLDAMMLMMALHIAN